ncbi:MAG: YkvA family protein [Sarcina sp.]
MNISQLAISLTGEDVKSMINDFVKVEGLTLNTMSFEEETLKVTGSFKKFVSLGFSATVEIASIENNILKVNLKKAALMNIGILKFVRKLALKIALKGVKEQGISLSEDNIEIDINKILGNIKFITLKAKEAKIVDNKLDVLVEDININLPEMMKKPTVKVEAKEEGAIEKKEVAIVPGENLEVVDGQIEEEEEKADYLFNIDVEKKDDVYSHGREAVVRTIPENVKDYSDIIMFVPDLVALVCRLLRDKRVPMKTRVALGLSFGYTVLPIDIIPDKFPILGQIDDIAVILFALERIVDDIEPEVLLENWQGKKEFVVVLTELVSYVSEFTGAKSLNKIYNVIDSLV